MAESVISSTPTTKPHCSHEGCPTTTDLLECHFADGTLDGRYCWDHTPAGFCKGCGLFCAGIESFDFAAERGNVAGFCEECSDAIKSDCGEDDDPDDDDPDDDDLDDDDPFDDDDDDDDDGLPDDFDEIDEPFAPERTYA